jgi:hypothetical protein
MRTPPKTVGRAFKTRRREMFFADPKQSWVTNAAER